MSLRLPQLVLAALSALCAPPTTSAVLSATTVPASAHESALLRLATERVIVFKDGHGLFVKRGSAVVSPDGTVFTDRVPSAAVLGTVWATVEGAELKSMSAGWVETTEEHVEESSCLTTVELLRANPGKAVTLGLEGKEVSGRLVEVLDGPPQPASRGALLASLNGHAEGEAAMEHEVAQSGGTLVVIDGTERGRLALPVAAVKSLAGKELGTHCRRTLQSATRQKRLTFDLGRGAAGKTVTVHLLYFTPGIRWIPTYRVDTGKSSRAELSLQAELINEEEDLENAALDLVVGVPTFRFKDTVSPLSLEQTLRAALAQAAPNLMTQMMSNAMVNDRVARDDEAPSAMGTAPELAGEHKQDLFVYPVKGFSLKKGARAAVPLWKSTVPQRHVYTADFTVSRGGNSGVADGRSPLKLVENPTWHQLELTDATPAPWTTGAALLMQDGFPLGQDTLSYTSAGAHALLPVTEAVDLRAQHGESELDRQVNALRLDGVSLTLVKKHGTVQLTSHRAEASTVRVTVSVGGKVTKADGAQITADDARRGEFQSDYAVRANEHSDLSWEVVLAPGETKKLGYDVSYYQ